MFAFSAPASSSTPVHKVPAQKGYFCAAEAVVHVVPHGLMALLQPAVASQLSAVHAMPSSHDLEVPAVHVPATQVAAGVKMSVAQLLAPQTVPSAAVVCWQPADASQLSAVHALLSLQFSAPVPAWHRLLAQTSPVVHALPSSHSAALGACWQPAAGSQLSLVHGLVSSQLTALPAWQAPLPQVSPTVQTLPSLQGAVLLADLQPP